jgi:hypothetical protein
MQADNASDRLPEVGGAQESAKVSRFRNFIRNTDALTEASGYINEIRPYQKDEETTLWFVRIGMIVGTVPDESKGEGARKPEFQNCDLLVGSTLRYWAETMKAANVDISRLRCRFKIRNLRFIADTHEGQPVLNSRGILETIEIGYLED